MSDKHKLQLVREAISRRPKDVLGIFDRLPKSKQFSQEQLLQGFQVEVEHANTVGGDSLTIAKIVLDHLSEHPRYYKKLKKAGL